MRGESKAFSAITAAATLWSDRRERNKFYYLNEKTNICDRAAQFKELVKAAYSAGSLEYKTVKATSFKKPKI